MDGILAGIASILLLGFYSFRSFSDLRNFEIWKSVILKSLAYGAIAFLTFFVLFPAMWFGPVEIIRRMVEEGIYRTAFSSTGAAMLVPFRHLYYFEAFFLRSLPTTVALVVLFPLFWRTKGEENLKSFGRANLLFLLVNWFILSIPGKTKDRYLVNFSPSLAVLASFSLYHLLAGLKKIPRRLILGLVLSFYALTIYRYHPAYSFYWNDIIGGQRSLQKLDLPLIKRGEYFAQAALFLNEYGEDPCNKNAVVFNKGQLNSFRWYFFGKTFSGPRLMPDGYHAHYFVCTREFRDQAPKSCRLVKTFGVRAPMPYEHIFVYDCGRTIDNTYEGIKN